MRLSEHNENPFLRDTLSHKSWPKSPFMSFNFSWKWNLLILSKTRLDTTAWLGDEWKSSEKLFRSPTCCADNWNLWLINQSEFATLNLKTVKIVISKSRRLVNYWKLKLPIYNFASRFSITAVAIVVTFSFFISSLHPTFLAGYTPCTYHKYSDSIFRKFSNHHPSVRRHHALCLFAECHQRQTAIKLLLNNRIRSEPLSFPYCCFALNFNVHNKLFT